MGTYNFNNLEGFVEHNENFTITEPIDRYRFTLTDPGQLNFGFSEFQSAIDWTLENDSGEVLETGRLTDTSSSDFSISDLVAGSYDLVFESQEASDYRFSLEPDYDAVTGLEITGGYFTVEEEDITVDYLLDGGRYEGQIGIFSLEGLEEFETGSPEWIEEVARRSASNSSLGHIIIDDRTDAARLDMAFDWESDVENGGTYAGRQTFSMNVGDRIGIILVPNGAIQEVITNPEIGGDKRPLFSLASANPNEMFHVGQIADAGSDVYILEDWRVDTSSDKDYNDIAFRLDGVRGEGIHKVEDLIDDPYTSWIEEVELQTAPQIHNVSLVEDRLDSEDSLELSLTAFDTEGIEDVVKFEIAIADGSGGEVETLEISNPSFENIEEKIGDFVWNYEVLDLDSGNYTLSVRAEDASGETSDTVEISFSVDLESGEDDGSGGSPSPGGGGDDTNNLPNWEEFQVEISQVDSSGILNVEGLISDADGASDIQSVTLVLKTADGDFVKEVVVETLTTEGIDRASFTTEFDLSQYNSGNYILEAIATDEAGAESKKNQEFAIDNDEKEDTLNPDDGSPNDDEPEINHPPEDLRFSILPVYTQGEDLAFDRARVFDEDGIDDLNRIDFWLENRQGQRIEIVEEDVTEFTEDSQGRSRFNFEYDLENLAPDRYALKAIAYDDSGAYSNLEVASFSLISDLGNGEILSDPVRLAIGESTDLDSYTAAEIEDTANWIVWLTPGTDATALAESLDATNLGESGFIPNTYIWDFSDDLSAEEITAAIENTSTVEVAYPDVPIPLRLLGRDRDGYEPLQWSLSQPIDPNDPNSHIIGVWEHPTLRNPKTGEPLSGEGVVVAIVDDGLLYDHQEFNPAKGGRYRFDLSWDYADNDDDPYPISVRSHEIPIEQTSGFAVDLTLDIPVHLTGLVKDISIQFDHSGLTDAEIEDLQNLRIKLKAPTKPLSDPGNWFSFGFFSWYYPGWNDISSNRSDFINVGDDGSFTLQNPDEFNHSFAGGDWKLQFYTKDSPPSADWQTALDKLDSFTLELTTLNPHGTAVGGILGDESGEVGTRGVAPNADIAALRLISNIDTVSGTEDVLGMAITNALYDPQRNQEIAIFNNSWGLPPFVNKPIAAAVIKLGSELRYNGLGNTYVFSAGNDRSRDIGSGLGYAQVNNYALTNSRHAIAVGAVTIKEENGDIQIVRAPYSNPGVFVSAFSNNGLNGDPDNTDIVTTGVDLDDPDWDAYLGVLSDESGFGGTSAAAPFVSGVVALMREVNPNLTNRDIQHILAETSYKVDPDHQPDEVDPDYNRLQSGWTTNGAGYDINYQYGFGAVNPKAAVELAAEWTTVDPEVRVSTHFLNVNDDLPNGGTVGLSDSVEVESDITLEWVEVVTDFAHEDWNDVTVILTSPDGTESVLRRSVPDFDTSGVELPPLAPKDPLNKGQWTFTTPRFWGESSEGEWTLQILDEKGNDISGEWKGWKLNLYGTEPDLPDSPSLFVEPTKRWTAQNGTPYWEKASDIAVDTEGNSYIVGFTPGDLNGNINAGYNREHAHGDAYISKFDAKGDLVWTQLLGGTEGDSFNQIELGKDGNLYITGTTYSSLAGTHQGSTDALFVKYDPEGNLIWSHQFGTAQQENLDGIVTDPDGNLYTVGYTAGELFDSPSANANGYDSIVIKWDTSGNQIWAKQMDFPSHVPMDVGFNAAENRLEMAGWIHGAFPGQTHEGYLDGFVASIDTDGNIVRTLQLGTSDRDAIHGIDIDRHGNIGVHGVTWGEFPGETQLGEGDIFAAKYNSDGELLWVRQFGSSEYDYGTYGDVQIDIFGNVLLSGTQSETTGSRFDGLVTAFNPQGQRIDWTEKLNASFWDGMDNIVLTNNSLYALGRSHASVDGQPYSGSMDVVIRKYDWKQIYTPGASLDINDVHASAPAGNPMTAILSLSDKDAGILSSNTSNSASIEFSDGVFRVTGSVEAVNAVLDDVQYTPSDGYTGDFIINTAVTDALGRTRLGRTLFLEATPPTTVNLEALDTEAHEDGDAAVFAVTREDNFEETLVVNYQIGGSANRDSDYQPLTGSVTLEAGQKGATISVVPNYDLLAEGDETVEITLTDGSRYELSSEIQGTATITDSSTIARYGSFIYENPDNGHLYIFSEPDTWYGAQAQAEALGGNLVTINDGDEQEWLLDTFGSKRAFWAGLTDNEIYNPSGEGNFKWVSGESSSFDNWPAPEPNNSRGVEDSLELNFTSRGVWNDRIGTQIKWGIIEIDPSQLDSPLVTMMATDAKAGENGNAGQIVIQRFDDLSQDLTLDLTVSGSATPGADYEALPNQVTIPAGEKLITVPIHALADDVLEDSESIVVELAESGDYSIAPLGIIQASIEDQNPINRIANEVIGRDVDVLDYWTERWQNGESLSDLRKEIIAVAKDPWGRYEADYEIEKMYQDLFSRNATPDEIATLRDRLGAGETLSGIRQDLEGADFIDAKNYVYTNPDTGNRYLLSQADTWLGAQEQAEALGGHLVAINSEAENQWLVDTFPISRLWIGLQDSPIYGQTEGNFQWVNGEALTYDNREGYDNVLHTIEGEDFFEFNFMSTREPGLWNDMPGDLEIINNTFPNPHGIIEIPASSSDPIPGWVRQFGGADAEMSNGLDIDATGNSYVVGSTMQPGVAGSWNPLISKYDSDGNLLWNNEIQTSSGTDYYLDTEVTADGSIYAVGYDDGLGNAGRGDMILARLDANGNEIWRKFIGDADQNWGGSLTSDSQGNLYLAGITVEFGAKELLAGFFGKYDRDGNEIWTQSLTGESASYIHSIELDSQENIYISGVTEANLNGETNSGGFDAFVSKYDPSGGVLWTELVGTSSDETPGIRDTPFIRDVQLAIDLSDNVYLTGTTLGTFDGQVNSGQQDSFVTKFDTDGNQQWLSQFGGVRKDHLTGVGVDSLGRVYVSGWTDGAFDGQTGNGSVDSFVVTYDAGGNQIQTQFVGGSDEDIAHDIQVDATGNVYLVGEMRSDLDGVNGGDRDAWVSRNWT